MKKTNLKKALLLLLSVVLIAAIALFVGCGNTNAPEETEAPVSTTQPLNEPAVIGEGKTEFSFTVVDLEGKETEFTVKTDKKTVGEALLDAKLIEGEDSQYGLYVKAVNGLALDYDTDKAYWAFYVNGEYAMSGVDATEIESSSKYSFKAEKA